MVYPIKYYLSLNIQGCIRYCYLNFFIDTSVLASNYSLSSVITTVTELFASDTALRELYPPLQLKYDDSFVTPDVNSTTDKVSSVTPENRLSGKKILGPV